MDFNDITLHKPLPIKKLFLYINSGVHTVDNLMSDSNLLPEPVLRPDGFGGQRMVAIKWKLTCYFNRFDNAFWYNVLVSGVGAYQTGRFPLKLLLGGSDAQSRAENVGAQYVSFTREPNILTFHYNVISANQFLKSSLVWTGITGVAANIWGDYEPE